MSYKAVHIVCNPDVEETVSFLLQEAGFEGASYEQGRLVAYCTADAYDETAVHNILQMFALQADQIIEIEDENWNATWEKEFKDAILGEHIQVRAPFHPKGSYFHDIIISPKMAFGTGHHETTRLSAISLEKLNCTNMRVLDMGCGSGILAILASQKGAQKVIAIDYDQKCIDNTIENIKLNKADNIMVQKADSVCHLTEKFDIIVSNIVKNINLRLLPDFVSKLNDGGRLILCGFLDEDLQEQKTAALAHDLKLIEQNDENHWLQTQYILEK